MPAAQTIEEPSALDLDVDALLNEADMLMGEVEANLNERTPGSTPDPGAARDASTAPGESASTRPAFDNLDEMAAEISATTVSVDPEAIAALLSRAEPPSDQQSPSTDSPAAPQAAPVTPPPAPPIPARTATPPAASRAPTEWMQEAGADQDGMDDELPQIPDDSSIGEVAKPAPAVIAHRAARRSARLLQSALRTAIVVLVLMDKPFAKLNSRIKSMIGMAAIATLTVAVATWVLGGRMHAS